MMHKHSFGNWPVVYIRGKKSRSHLLDCTGVTLMSPAELSPIFGKTTSRRPNSTECKSFPKSRGNLMRLSTKFIVFPGWSCRLFFAPETAARGKSAYSSWDDGFKRLSLAVAMRLVDLRQAKTKKPPTKLEARNRSFGSQ